MKFYKSKNVDPAVKYLENVITGHLKKNERILWLVSGGSAIEVSVGVGKELPRTTLANLFITLTDERFVSLHDNDSNWKQLLDSGFNLPGAKLLPVLNNEEINTTTHRYTDILKKVMEEADYKIALFGMGPDGHIAALFPHHPALKEDKLYATHLDDSPKPPPVRITMTIPAIMQLDEVVLYVNGEDKRLAIENLQQDLSINEQPAQILKQLPKLTIFNDQIGETA
jgi:6-phosphogluconolactonase